MFFYYFLSFNFQKTRYKIINFKFCQKKREAYERLSKKFELFKVECEKELYEQLNEQFQKCLSEKLDDVTYFNILLLYKHTSYAPSLKTFIIFIILLENFLRK